MAVIDALPRRLSVRPVDSVGGSSRVRHVDELDEASQQGLYEAVHGDGAPVAIAPGSDLRDGEVIVFTEYVRIELT